MGLLKVFGLQRVAFQNAIHGERMDMTRFRKKKKKFLKQCAKSNNYLKNRIEKPILNLDVYIANN